jgi:hypothetical protein
VYGRRTPVGIDKRRVEFELNVFNTCKLCCLARRETPADDALGRAPMGDDPRRSLWISIRGGGLSLLSSSAGLPEEFIETSSKPGLSRPPPPSRSYSHQPREGRPESGSRAPVQCGSDESDLQGSLPPATGRSRGSQNAGDQAQLCLDPPHLPVVDGRRIRAQPGGSLSLEEPQV